MSNVKISALPTGTIADTDTVPVVKAGVTTAVPFLHTHATLLLGPVAGTLDATAGTNVYGPIYKLGRPDLIAWSWQNQGTSTVVDANGASFLTIPGTTTNIRSRLITAPARPYTITALLRNNGIGLNNQYCGLCFRESGTSKIYIYYLLVNATLQAVKFTNDTTFSAVGAVNTAWLTLAQTWHWLQVTDDGVNLIFSFSSDGVNFTQMGTESRTAFMAGGPDQVGFFADTDGAGGFSMTLASWVQT